MRRLIGKSLEHDRERLRRFVAAQRPDVGAACGERRRFAYLDLTVIHLKYM